MASATKTTAQVMDWTLVEDANNVIESSNQSLATYLKSSLMVTVGHADNDANALGLLVRIEGRYGTADKDWHKLYEVRMGAGTAGADDLDGDASATYASITLTNGYPTVGDKWFIYDQVNISASEVATTTSNASTNWTVLDGIFDGHLDETPIYDGVAEKQFPIPDEVSTVRVVFVNDDADADMVARVDLSAMTAIG